MSIPATTPPGQGPRAPRTPAEHATLDELDELLADGPPLPAGPPPPTQAPQPTPPAESADPAEPPAVALLLHTAVPPATDHPYRPHASPASTTSHLAGRHGIQLDGEHAQLLAEQFTDPDQLHRFAHEPTDERAVVALLVDPLVDQLLDLLDQQLPRDLHPIVLAEAALAVRLLDPSARPASPAQAADDGPPAGSRP